MLFDPLNIPKLTKHITDFSGVLSDTERESLSLILNQHESTTTEQVAVVLIPHREGHELLDIGLKIFNENGIGQKNLNNGLLLIIATEEKKIRIITGKGMEIKYSEMYCRDIIENHLRALLDNKNYRELIQEFIHIIQSPYTYEGGINETPQEINSKPLKKKSDLRWTLLHCYLFGFIFPLTNDGYIWGLSGLICGILSFLVLRNSGKDGKIWCYFYPFSFLLSGILVMMSVIMLFSPARCILNDTTSFGKKYSCERNILGYKYRYTRNISIITTNSSNNYGNYKNQSTSSSFGGGGGSSNGGGYGD